MDESAAPPPARTGVRGAVKGRGDTTVDVRVASGLPVGDEVRASDTGEASPYHRRSVSVTTEVAMALISSPGPVVDAARRTARRLLRRALGVPDVAEGEMRKVEDDLPRDAMFAQPLTVAASVLGEPEPTDDGSRLTFRVLVRDADGKRCSNIHVEARVTGPERTAVGETTTDMFGAARFRMTGPPGEYAIDVLEVAALGLEWDRSASTATSTTTVA